jgi:hypothetical protein
MPRLLNMIHNQDQYNVSKQEHQQLKHDLQSQSILAETIKKVDWFGSSALAGTALGMAKIVSHGNTSHCSKSYSLIAASRHRKSYSSCLHRMPSCSSPDLMLDPSPVSLTHMPLSDSSL